jgi:hypothetical protein
MPTCRECKECKPFGFASFQCLRKEGEESGCGESNVDADDDACVRFDPRDQFALCDPPRTCYRCGDLLCYGDVLNLSQESSALCGCCDDQETHIRQDARED